MRFRGIEEALLGCWQVVAHMTSSGEAARSLPPITERKPAPAFSHIAKKRLLGEG